MKLSNLIFRHFYSNREQKKERSCFLDWLSEHIDANEYALVAKGNSCRKLFFEAPYYFGDKPKRGQWSPNEKKPSFVLVAKGKEKDIPFSLDENWSRIGEGDFFALYETKDRFGNHLLPLRFGLSEPEKRQALAIARSALDKFLENSDVLKTEELKELPQRFFMLTDLDVALWVRGSIRGSCVLEKKPLVEGLIEAAILASRDSRFKPLSYQELQDTRIEVTLISDLKLLLSRRSIGKNKILPHKGYRLNYKGKKGWFLPEVFNVKHFRNLTEFLDNLAQEKAGLPPKIWNKAEIEIFDVGDFMEGSRTSEVLDLCGPIAISSDVENTISDEGRLRKKLELAADWLLNIQENDGNFPPVINPLTGQRTQIDWPRSAFTGWALAEFVFFTKEKKYEEAVKKHFDYVSQYAGEVGYNFEVLTFAYAGQEAAMLYKITQQSNYYRLAVKMAEKILNVEPQINFDGITFQQAASFLVELARTESRFLEPAQRFADVAKNNFEDDLKKDRYQNLAVQVELVNTFDKIFQLTKDGRYKEFSYRVAEWLAQYQFSQGPQGNWGPFAESTNSAFVYTRGTGKIFEVLAGLPEFRDAAKKALAWLLAMQYDDDNTFFVPIEIRPKIIGALRHDYFNQEAWIDSVGHFLLGGVRLLNIKSK